MPPAYTAFWRGHTGAVSWNGLAGSPDQPNRPKFLEFGRPDSPEPALHIAPTTGGIYRIRKAKKKGHLFFGQTVSMKDQLLERSRRLSDKPTCILAYGSL